MGRGKQNPYVCFQQGLSSGYNESISHLLLRIDGFPKAYAKICPDRGFGPYAHDFHFTRLPIAPGTSSLQEVATDSQKAGEQPAGHFNFLTGENGSDWGSVQLLMWFGV